MVAALVALMAVFGVLVSSARAATTISVGYLAGAQDALPAMLASFERANPDIKVDLRQIPAATYDQILLTQLRAGNAPDVFFVTPGTGTVAAVQILARAGRLAPLPSSIARNVLPLSKSVVSYKGKVYAWPAHVGATTAYYDSTEFSRMGLTVPKTFDQLLKLCRTVRKAGKSLFLQPAAQPQPNSTLLAMIAVQELYSKDPKWNIKRTLGKVKFAGDPGWERALRNFRSMGNAGCFNDGAIGVSLLSASSVWAKGKSLGLIGNIGVAHVITSSTPNVKLSSFAFPATRAADTRVVLSPSTNFAVNAKAADGAAAMKFMKWFSQPAQQRQWAKGQNGAIAPVDYVAGRVSELYRPLSSYFKSDKAVLNPDYKAKPSFFLSRAAVAQGLLLGKMSIAAALSEFDRSWHD